MEMELIQKGLKTRLVDLARKVSEDNLFLLASSVSYYSALGIAPFLLILLGVASILGGNYQSKILTFAFELSPEFGKIVQLIFSNLNNGVDFGSISGIIGFVILLSTASLVFLQLRYAFDVIYGHYNFIPKKSFLANVLERLFAVGFVFIAGIFLIFSSSLPGVVLWRIKGNEAVIVYQVGAFILNFLIYVAMFWGIHYLTPSKRPQKKYALKMGILSSVFFIIGNTLLGIYLRNVAISSIYGAAGSLLIFLIWTYYSSFTLFLSVELYLFFKKTKKYH
jgi:membrane protein